MGKRLEKACDYDYSASGIPVVLVGFTGKRGDGDVVIANVNVLHRLLAEAVATKPGCLDGPELKFLRSEQGLDRTQMAELVNLPSETIDRLEKEGFVTNRSLGCDYIYRILAFAYLGIPIPAIKDIIGWATFWHGRTTYYVDASDPENYRLTGSLVSGSL